MRSVSGLRGIVGEGLTPEVAVRHAAAFGIVVGGGRIVLGGDTRPTGPMIRAAVVAGLTAVGCDVIDIGICPTPTIPLAVTRHRAKAGLAVTASHNPAPWNALKFLGSARALFPPEMIERVYRTADTSGIRYRAWNKIGRVTDDDTMCAEHVRRVCQLSIVDADRIRKRRVKVAYDAGGGAGAPYMMELFRALGCRVTAINLEPPEPGRNFPRGPEPVPKHLRALCHTVKDAKADIGMATDPDSDRLALVGNGGRPLGEERTLALATYWVLSRRPGPVAVNVSTSRVIDDIAAGFGQKCHRSRVGEINVARMMKSKRAVIGGEGNGGVIHLGLHPGRDALLGAALVLSLMANANEDLDTISRTLPVYHAAKQTFPRPRKFDQTLERLARKYIQGSQDRTDGLKVILDDGTVHARPSNTEPIIRLTAEAKTKKRAVELVVEAAKVMRLAWSTATE